MQDLALLTLGRFTVTPTGLLIAGNPTYGEYKMMLKRLEAVESGLMWAYGDLLASAEDNLPEVWAQLLEISPYKIKTLQNAQWVARVIPRVERRGPPMTFTHHLEAARVTDPTARRALLDRAEAEKWTTEQMRSEVNQHQGRAEGLDLDPASYLCETCKAGLMELDKRTMFGFITGLAEVWRKLHPGAAQQLKGRQNGVHHEAPNPGSEGGGRLGRREVPGLGEPD